MSWTRGSIRTPPGNVSGRCCEWETGRRPSTACLSSPPSAPCSQAPFQPAWSMACSTTPSFCRTFPRLLQIMLTLHPWNLAACPGGPSTASHQPTLLTALYLLTFTEYPPYARCPAKHYASQPSYGANIPILQRKKASLKRTKKWLRNKVVTKNSNVVGRMVPLTHN